MVRVRDLTADASPTGDDLLHGTNNPGGTPGSRKWTLDNTLNYLLTRTQTWTGVNSFSDNIQLSATKKLFLDGGSNTSLREDSADSIMMELGGNDSFRFEDRVNEPTFTIKNGVTGEDYEIGRDSAAGFLLFAGKQNSFSGFNFTTQESAAQVMQASISNIGDVILRATNRIYFDGTDGTGKLDSGDTWIDEVGADRLRFAVGNVGAMEIAEIGTEVNTVIGKQSALATSATSGFLYIPSMAGAPTGNSVDYTGKFPIVWDSTNKNLMINTATTTWEKIGKARAVCIGSMEDTASSSSGTRVYVSPFGFNLRNQSTTQSTPSMPITAAGITVKRVRIFVDSDGVNGGDTFDVGVWNVTDNAAVHSEDATAAGTNIKIDSGDITVSVTGGDELAFYYEPNGTVGTAVELWWLIEYEYD